MERGQEIASGEGVRQLAIQAAGLYLFLLVLPGSGAFKIFHPVLYSRALDTFTIVTTLGLEKKSPKKKGAKNGSQESQRRGGGRGSQHVSVIHSDKPSPGPNRDICQCQSSGSHNTWIRQCL